MEAPSACEVWKQVEDFETGEDRFLKLRKESTTLLRYLMTMSFHLHQKAPMNVDEFGKGVINTQAIIWGMDIQEFIPEYERMFL